MQTDLIADVQKYTAFTDDENAHVQSVLAFLNKDTNPFDRKNFMGHITGSAWLLSPDSQSVLLMHHMILDKWLQFGGHADGEADIRNVARREAQEESGIDNILNIKSLSDTIFDVDVHAIPENAKKQEPHHLHYDIRYIFKTDTLDFSVTPESKALKWVHIDDIFGLQLSPSIIRMARKWQDMLQKNLL